MSTSRYISCNTSYKTIRILRILTVLLLGMALGGCRLVLIVPEGGEMRTALLTDTLSCDAQQECTIEITSANFYEIFYAVPHAGWMLSGWTQTSGFICGLGRGTSALLPNVCVVDNTSFAGNAGLLAVIANPALTISITPNFVQEVTGVPITDTITVSGKEWAQPADFTGFSWDGITAVCPGGVCGPGAIINGYDMNGWTMASLTDINDLANHYLAGEYTMGPGPDSYDDAVSATGSMLTLPSPFSGGPWKATPTFYFRAPTTLAALTVTENVAESSRVHVSYFTWTFDPFNTVFIGTMATDHTLAKSENSLEHGAFFYRLP